MKNLLNCIEISTIFLDSQLKNHPYTEEVMQKRSCNWLTRFEPAFARAAPASNSNMIKWWPTAAKFCAWLVFKQTEMQTEQGQWFLLRIMPYRAAENDERGAPEAISMTIRHTD